MIAANKNIYNDVLANFFNGFGDLFRFAVPAEKELNALRINTDVKENDESYDLDMELPGFDKSEVAIELKNGYLTVTATHSEEDTSNFIRKERYTGSYARSIYLGNDINKEQIKASFINGVLKINIPKEALLPKESEENKIEIGD